MNIFKKSIILLIVILLAFAVGCEKQAEVEETDMNTPADVQATPTPVPTLEPTLAPTATPGVYSIKQGYSPTTGLPSDKEYEPIAVIIENHPDARPQSGLSMADWVYEIYVEGMITRFIAIFNDTLPEKVGPVRSVRVNHLDIQQEWNAALVHWGASDAPTAVEYTATYRIPKLDFPFRADAHKGLNDDNFWRDNDRNRPHNAYSNLLKTSGMFEADIKPVPHNFSEALMSGGTDCNNFKIVYNTSSMLVEYEYNAENNKYLRSVSNKEFKDKETGEQIEVSNIIIQRVDHKKVYVYYIMDLVGEGPAEFIMGGKHFTGTWKSDSVKDKTYFYLDSGEEITLLPGNTWVQVVFNDTKIDITQ